MAVRGPAPELVTARALWPSYPFLPGAEALLDELEPSLGDLLADPAYARARELGRARLRAAANDPSGLASVAELERAGPEERFLSFQYARLLLAVTASAAPGRRWAVAEARRAGDRLAGAAREAAGELLGVARELGHPMEPEGLDLTLALPDYLRLSSPIREPEFRLVRQRLRRGRVTVSRDAAVRLLVEGVRQRITDTPPVTLAPAVRDRLEAAEAEFLRDLAERVPAPVERRGPAVLRAEGFPPCIRKMRAMLQHGENLSHAGRFALAAFLHRAGASFDTIVDSYRGAPDFDEGISRYQIEHITQRDGGRGYEPPTCETLRTNGLCFRDGDPAAADPADRRRDPLCYDRRVVRPLDYYRIKSAAAEARRPPGAPATPTGPG